MIIPWIIVRLENKSHQYEIENKITKCYNVTLFTDKQFLIETLREKITL
jgi:hypothetical protein